MKHQKELSRAFAKPASPKSKQGIWPRKPNTRLLLGGRADLCLPWEQPAKYQAGGSRTRHAVTTPEGIFHHYLMIGTYFLKFK